MLGAPELFSLGALAEESADLQRVGRRVVAIGTTTAHFPTNPDDGPPPTVLLGIAVLAEDLRKDTRETIAFLLAEGVDVKVLSGDAPETVASIAADAGVPVVTAHDGRDLPTDRASREVVKE